MANGMSYQNWAGVSLVGRILLSAIFIISGLSKIWNFGATRDLIAAHGVPIAPFFTAVSLFIEIVAGGCLLIGLRGRLSALVLALYLIPVTLTFHNFWSYSGSDHQLQLVNFLKNLSIMGGLSQVVAMGAGPISIDQFLFHRGWRGEPGETRLRRVS